MKNGNHSEISCMKYRNYSDISYSDISCITGPPITKRVCAVVCIKFYQWPHLHTSANLRCYCGPQKKSHHARCGQGFSCGGYQTWGEAIDVVRQVCAHGKWKFCRWVLPESSHSRTKIFRPSATVSRIGPMESCMCHRCRRGPPPPTGWAPPPQVECYEVGSLMESYKTDPPQGWPLP